MVKTFIYAAKTGLAEQLALGMIAPTAIVSARRDFLTVGTDREEARPELSVSHAEPK